MTRFVIIFAVTLCLILGACSEDDVVTPQEDKTPPSVVGVSPANGSTGVPVDTTLMVRFSERVDPLTVNASSFYVSGAAGSVARWNDTATFTPSSDLRYATVCTVTVTTEVTDLVGNHMSHDYQWTFTAEGEPAWRYGTEGE